MSDQTTTELFAAGLVITLEFVLGAGGRLWVITADVPEETPPGESPHVQRQLVVARVFEQEILAGKEALQHRSALAQGKPYRGYVPRRDTDAKVVQVTVDNLREIAYRLATTILLGP